MKATINRLKPLKSAVKTVVAATALSLAAVSPSFATVTVQGWWHLDSSQPINDSSGNSRTFSQAYSTANTLGGAFVGIPVINGAGGPLDSTGFSSTNCVEIALTSSGAKAQSAMWAIGYNPPATNYGIEIWVLPQDNGIAGGSGGWVFSTGQSGGVYIRVNSTDSGSYFDAAVLGNSHTIGDQVPIDTNRWMHLALVNDGGVVTFYTNGVPCGASSTNATVSAGDVYIGTPNDNQAYYGYLDEARMFTFAPGAFSTNDLLLRPPGPNIITQPQSIAVWDGGAATFRVNPSFDNSLAYQWQKGGANQPGQNNQNLYLNIVSTNDNNTAYDVVVTGDSISRTTSVATATLTVVEPSPVNIAAYRDTVNAESSLVAYYPIDSDTGTTATDTKDHNFNGLLELGATFDGQTNTTFGTRSLSFNFDGDVNIPNNPAFEFSGGSGTIEAIIYLSQAAPSGPTIFSEDYDGGGGTYYTIGASANGSSLTYTSDGITFVSWSVPGGLIGKLTHVAFVFENSGQTITAYANGINLGANTSTGFGAGGGPAWIGGLGTSTTSGRWAGTIDELAIYGSALSQNDIQLHYSKFFYGTNTAAPSFISQSGSKTIFAGSSPVIVTKTTGTLPLSYAWTANGSPVSGATSSTLALSNVTTSATYQMTVENAYGSTTSAPIVLTVVAPPTGYAATAMADHPTAFWRLSETNGTTAIDSAGFNDATYSGGFTLGAPAFHGETGTGVKLDGSTGRAIAPQSTVLNPSGPFTIEFWASITSYGFYVPVGSMDRPARTGGYEFYLFGNYPGYEFHTAAGGGYSAIDGDNTVPPVGDWFHVVGVYDGTNIIQYVNGALADAANLQPVALTPNLVGGFYIGSREDDTHYFAGTLSDVAFYNYAFTPDQVVSHYSVSYTPTVITTQPVGVTNTEGSTINLAVAANGLPNSYQWYKDNVALSLSDNSDGTAHYPNDVTNTTLTIAQTLPSDSGVYKVVISNPLGGQTSTNATVLIVPDTNAPAVVSVIGLGTPSASGTPYLVKVLFNKRMDPATAGDFTKYSLSPSVAISSVALFGNASEGALAADWRSAVLVTAGLTPGTKYTLTVGGVKDQATTPNTLTTSSTSFHSPSLIAGKVNWDYYYLGTASDSTLDALQGDPNYPNAPQTNVAFNVFDSDVITGGDLAGNPAFGPLGDHYGSVVSGLLKPTVTGDYTFFIASDDASELDLSTDTNPANAVQIAYEPTCCHGFSEPGDTFTSDPQHLVAGTSYFIRALHVEGGGGDYVKVAWRISTDTTPAANLNPIPGSFLSSYQAIPAPAFGTSSVVNGVFTLNWTGTGAVIQESTDLKTWTPVAGNPNPLVVTIATAPVKFYRLVQ